MDKLINGKIISNDIKEEIKKEVEKLEVKPKLVVIQVGDNDASNIYIKNKGLACKYVGMNFEHLKFSEDILESELTKEIEQLNNNSLVNGIIVQLPLPKNLNTKKILNKVDFNKDVDGLTDINLGKLFNGEENLTPCTPTGIIYLLKKYNIELKGKHVVIVGRSILVGKPLIHMLLNEDATVSICHSKTNNLKKYTKQADILIVAIGKKQFIKKDMVKKNVIVIDVGINKFENKISGDVDFDNVIKLVSLITPVPNGIGPMTIAMLLKNTLKSYKLANNK